MVLEPTQHRSPPRVSLPPPTQENASMDITLTFSPITLLDVQFDTPSPSPPFIEHTIPCDFLWKQMVVLKAKQKQNDQNRTETGKRQEAEQDKNQPGNRRPDSSPVKTQSKKEITEVKANYKSKGHKLQVLTRFRIYL
ncbi:hypothetical protein Tco_0324618 [Tanacetum coccineum]